ncbi:putative monovalent cation/H+ antiporter subunit A [Salinimicrobium tongyeongense]|uniref:Monovalent cation/H+ antiporter subunit A n=1 Tax=Salinimicrobium tongyeongense TaxID=2809707 RepID=A0ABY6NUE2_9FLAO|nr:putative monovalent cation/H+ antiporter subunit A [Salinimicrobium tongyeongense]UZH56423.1 putative monovalent cation/H+ antiporter subunit A [Salinimicrobium tongyeongense]
MLSAILLGFIFSIFLVFAGKYFKGKLAVLSSLVPLVLFLYFLSFIPQVASGEVIRANYQWVPSLGLNLDFALDGLSLLFSLLITGIGFLVFAYTAAYLKGHDYLDRFYGYLGMFMGAMLGLVLSDNLLSMFIFWELTSISSFFLIGFNNTSEASRKSAVLALAITGSGGFLLLAGSLLLGGVAGTYSISEMVGLSDSIVQSESYLWIVLLIFGAAFTKSAQFPFHFWLPGAMKAPTPVSTYLHSATMVKAGIYLLLRFTPVLGGEDIWNTTLITVGGITMFYAAVHTLFRTDLKGVLAYSTIAVLGLLVFLIGLGTEYALTAAAVYIIVHALYKATLFLVTGIIDHETGMRDITRIAGLRKVMFPVAIAGFLAALSSAGMPPFVGFIGKDLVYESTLHMGTWSIVLTVLAIATNILVLYAGFVAGIKPFTGTLPESFSKVHLPGFLMWLPPVVLAVLGLVVGLFPGIIDGPLIQPVVSAVGIDSELHLKLWHGFNTVLGLSALTLAVGFAMYFLIKPSKSKERGVARFDFISPLSLITSFGSAFRTFSNWWTRIFQNGFLRNYVSTIILFLVVLVGYSLFSDHDGIPIDFSSFSRMTYYEMIIMGIMFLAIFFVIGARSRLTAVVAMGVVGYAICLMFVIYSAPDLAMTQFSIDTLTVILFVLVLSSLPKYLSISDYKMKAIDGVLSVAFGILITLIALEVLGEPVNKEVSNFYADNAYVMAKGKNVVNVILVDFRGVDTLMEISVLTIAAIGVFSLLKLRLRRDDRELKD